MKKIIFASIIALIFIGCGDKKKEDNPKSTPNGNVGKIEVVENQNKNEIKVAEKAIDKKGDKYYFSYNKDEKKTYTKLDANLRVRSPYEDVEISLLVSKLSKDFIVKCSACHNDYANGVIGPSLLGKDLKFITKSIMDFKTGVKKNILMSELVRLMSEAEINKLAKEITDFNKKIEELKAR